MSRVILCKKIEAGNRFETDIVKFVLMIVVVWVINAVQPAQAEEVCGPEVKQKVAELLAEAQSFDKDSKIKREKELYEEFFYCSEDTPTTTKVSRNLKLNGSSAESYASALIFHTDPFTVAARQCGAFVSQKGSLAYEEMSCCGYDPQRRQFACPVKIKRDVGFGGAPLPGSREFVLHCVADANGVMVPVGKDSVHLANEMFNFNPPWQFAVIANANINLQTIYPMTGETRRARSILSWGFEPTSCNFQPIWGNALNYQIRLDQ